MDTYYESKYHEIEESHWWFRARRDIILRLVKKLPKNIRVLEVGCSAGPLLADLVRSGYQNIAGLDISENAIALARERGSKNVKVADGRATGYSSESFDVVIASDVLEHIDPPTDALAEWRRILAHGGTLIIFVPAHMFLWSAHDEANQHILRFSRVQLRQMIASRGFTIEKLGFWNCALFPVTAAIRLLQQVLGGGSKVTGQLHSMPRFIDKILFRLLWFENLLILQGMACPFGVSLFCIARKPHNN